MRRALRALALACAIGGLGGCATQEFLAPAQSVEFELSGRIAVRWRDESSTGNVRWRHHAGGDEMLISTPLGQGVARIVREAGNVTLTTAEDRTYRAKDASSLTEQVLGFRLPLEGLADWIRARVSPVGRVTAVRRNADGRLALLEQDGWRIEYLAWDDAGQRPRRLRPSMAEPAIDMRIAIGEWLAP